MPVGEVFEIVRRCRDELKVNTCCGASNVSFGLPNRGPLNATFLAMAIAAGLTSAITNPIEEHIRTAIRVADVMTGNDENCMAWIMANREPKPEGAPAEGARRERRCPPECMTTGLIICGALAREVIGLVERLWLGRQGDRRAGHLSPGAPAHRACRGAAHPGLEKRV